MAVQRAAHTIKASAATIGAYVLADQCEALESLARQRDLRTADAQIARIAAACAAVVADLAAARPRFAAPGNISG
jgi:HPt (histidine-containing phosphotransfer) domain-containing protein